MALTFPLTTLQFLSLLPIARLTLDCPETVATSWTRGGEILTAERGARLWRGEIVLDQMLPDEAATVLPLLGVLRGAGASFLLTDPLRPRPWADRAGSNTLSTAKLGSAAGRELTLTGLPASYVLRSGDLISWTYGTNPVRYALHEIVTGSITASGTGTTAAIEVTPPIRSGAAAGTAVRLITPWCKCVLEPGSIAPGRRRAGGLVEDVSFKFIQTLR